MSPGLTDSHRETRDTRDTHNTLSKARWLGCLRGPLGVRFEPRPWLCLRAGVPARKLQVLLVAAVHRYLRLQICWHVGVLAADLLLIQRRAMAGLESG